MEEYNILSLGAGVQSSTIALMAENKQLIVNNKIIKIDFAVFADTGNEPEEVYNWLTYLENHIKSFPIYRVSRGNLGNDNYILKNNGNQLNLSIPMFTSSFDNKKPGMLQRRCTRDYKIRPIINFIKKKLSVRKYRKYERILIDKEIGYKKGNIKYNVSYPEIKVNQFIGISTDEASRIKESSEKWMENIYPLIEMNMSRIQCIDWMSNNSLPTPPRSACYFCPYKSDAEWLYMKNNLPVDFQKAIDFEVEIQRLSKLVPNMKGIPYLHKKCQSINEVVLQKDNNEHQFNNECEGMCGN